MPKTKRINNAQAVRNYMARHPQAGPSVVAKALTNQGVPVKPNYVSVVAFHEQRRADKSAKRIRLIEAGLPPEFTLPKQCLPNNSSLKPIEALMILYKAAKGQATITADSQAAVLQLIDILA